MDVKKVCFVLFSFSYLKDKKKTCCLDPIPTKLVLGRLDILLPVITKIINYSLEHGVFPSVWKNALVFPLLKKDGLEPIFKNYRPVSNLQFISKLTESAVAKQLQHHINMNNLFPSLQSSYRKFHSTESALLKVQNDILLNMNRQHVTLFVLLDLSAAFDTIDHGILLERLRSAFGVRDSAVLVCIIFKWQNSASFNRRHTLNEV